MNSATADAGQKSVFIEWVVKDPKPSMVYEFVKGMCKRSEVFYAEVIGSTVKMITGDATPAAPDRICHNFRDTGTCKFGEKCKYIHDPNSKKKFNSDGGANQKKKDSKSSKQPEGSRKVTSADRSTLTKPRTVSKVATAIMNELSEKTFKNASSQDAKAFGQAIMEIVNRMKEQPGKVTVGCLKAKVDEPTNGNLDVGASGASERIPSTAAQHPQLATSTGPSISTIDLIPKDPIVNSLFDYMGESNSDNEGPIRKGYIGRIVQVDQKIIVNMLRRAPPQQIHYNVEDYEIDYADRLADGEAALTSRKCFKSLLMVRWLVI